MLAGGILVGEHGTPPKLQDLFVQFKSLDELARTFQSEKQVVIKLGKRELILSRIERKNRVDPEIYCRMTRMEDGKWITVQMRRWQGSSVDRTVLEIFDDKGKAIASVNDWDGDTGDLVISKHEWQKGKAALIQGALLAVTGKNYSVDVSAE